MLRAKLPSRGMRTRGRSAGSRIVTERVEGAGFGVVHVDVTIADVVDPTVNGEFFLCDLAGNGRMSAEVIELQENVFFDEAAQLLVLTGGLAARLNDAQSRVRVLEPGVHGGHGGELIAMQQAFHGAAISVPADNDLTDLECLDSVLNNSRDAAEHLAVCGHEVADVAGDEEITWAGLGYEFGVDAGVGASDEEGVRPLRLTSGTLVTFAILGIDFAAEAAYTVEESFECLIGAHAFFIVREGREAGRRELRGAGSLGGGDQEPL